MMTNRQFLTEMPSEVLATMLNCPNDFYHKGYAISRIACNFPQTADCNACITKWLDARQSIGRTDEEEEG